MVLFHFLPRPESAACTETTVFEPYVKHLRTCGKIPRSTHLAHTRRRRVADLKAADHIRRQEAALRAAGTRSSPLCSTRLHLVLPLLSVIVERHVMLPLPSDIVKPHRFVVVFHVFGKARISCLRKLQFSLSNGLKLTDLCKTTPSTHLDHTHRRMGAESKAADHIRRREAALRAAGTRCTRCFRTRRHRVAGRKAEGRSSPLRSINQRVMRAADFSSPAGSAAGARRTQV